MSPPLWLKIETGPGTTPVGTGCVIAQTPSWKDAKPTQFGPMISTSRPSAMRRSAASRARPSSVRSSPKPFETMTTRAHPRATSASHCSTAWSAFVRITPRSGSPGTASSDGRHGRPSSSW